MLLKTVTISGYRSITGTATLHLDPTVTVILGANDHGKTNILRAIEHLKTDSDFTEGDLSWDRDDPSLAPSVEFLFELAHDERAEIDTAFANDALGRLKTSDGVSRQDPPSDGVGKDDREVEQRHAPHILIAKRVGVEGSLVYQDAATGESLPSIVGDFTPFVELIEPRTSVSDTVTAAEIVKRETGFMRGIFWYAGLDPDDSADLFFQTHRTTRRLEDASETLNATIKKSWSQGKDLHFILQHNSAKKSIDLMIKDPSVQNRYVSPSHRSAGFTQFFTIKTILYARQQEQATRSYMLLFDEPGIYLHPSGQQDLLQVIESLARTHQTVYVTHSLFMINKSYPVRHRLVTKSLAGTQIEGKPYVGRWARALTALGMSLSGTIMFASHVLLTEGDSDPIYLNAVMQKLIEVGKLQVDLNSFAAIATGQSSEADALIRILLESQPTPALAMLVDGDKGGKNRLARVRGLLDKSDIPSKVLKEDTTIEDYLLNLSDVFVEAVAAYAYKVGADNKVGLSAEEIRNRVKASFDARFGDATAHKGVAAWLKDDVPQLVGLDGPLSKVGIAREYAALLQALPAAQLRTGAVSRPLIAWIVEAVKLPVMGVDESKVLTESNAIGL